MSEPMVVVVMGLEVDVEVEVLLERGKKQSRQRKCSMAQPHMRRRKEGMGRRKTRSPELLRDMDKQRINRWSGSGHK
jgi:hypothetical protein